MQRSKVRDKIKWTEVMILDLLSCKQKALDLVNSEENPKYPNGRKIGYMKHLFNFWNEKGYEHFKFTEQNLSDRARNIESKQNKFLTPITQTVDDDRIINFEVLLENQDPVINSATVNEANILSEEKLNRLTDEADNVFDDISANVGDFSKRDIKTKFRATPTNDDMQYINKACESLITNRNVMDLSSTLMAFWFMNCILYAVIKAWVAINDIKNMQCNDVVKYEGTCNSKRSERREKVPKCVLLIDKEIKVTRALISKAAAELNRIQFNGRLTRKSKRNRLEIMENSNICKVISSYNLTCYMEKLKKRLKYLSKKRSRKLKSEKAKTLNTEFKNDQKKVFDKFRSTIEKDPENLKPIYKERIESKRYFEKPEDVEKFWGELWESKDKGNPLATWIEPFEEKFAEIIPEVDEKCLQVDESVCFNAIRKKKNWSSPGPDMIVNFWLKKLPSIISASVKLFYNLINVESRIERWVSRGRVALIPKDGEWTVSNQRPITCLNTMYKWLTSILLIFHNAHIQKYQLLQIDQRGAKCKSTGTVNNLLIDDTVLRDAALHHRNLFCFWIDVKKAFDSVSHSWLLKMLEIHRFPSKLIKIFESIISSWSVQILIPVENGSKESKVINLTNGILQGDSYCPALYVLTMNIVSWVLRSTEGYVLSAPISEKVTHTLYIDDLKGYTKSLERLKFILNLIKAKMEDAGLIWNPKKCKFMAMKRGKFSPCDKLILTGGVEMKCLGEADSYEFMGVPQRTKMNVSELSEEIHKVVKQRSHIIWSSDLSDVNKCQASNMFLNSAIEYFFWPVKFPIEFIREMDASVRETMNLLGAKHTNQMNCINYLPRDKGGRGLRSLEETYKTTKIKLAVKLHQETDKRLDLVKQFHKKNLETKSFSIFKDSARYASEIGLRFNITENGLTITDNDNNEVIKECVNTIGRKIKEKHLNRNRSEVLSSTWQGLNLIQRMNDADVEKSYFNWLKSWKTCPTNVVHEYFLLFYQLLPTKQYKLHRSKETIDDTTCRMCHKFPQESVKHLLSNCEEFVKGLYKRRHDNALKCFVWALLYQFDLIEKKPSWYADDKVKPYYKKGNFEFWWDIPQYTGRDDEPENPLRPDGKVMMENENGKFIYLIEMTVPWSEIREDRYMFKCKKYEMIQQSLKLEYPDYNIGQITLAIDVFGGYSKNLIENLSILISDKGTVNSIIKEMQKVVISSIANLSRTFKIRVR